jgi:N-acetylmuramoyl-L-alanine amidase
VLTAALLLAGCGAPPRAVRSPRPAQPPLAAATTTPLAGRTVVVDPGHGLYRGRYTGDRGVNGVYEDQNVLAIATDLAALLRADGARVVLTRGPQDPGPPPLLGLIARVRTAARAHPDALISIHQDASSDPSVHGVWTYYWRRDSLPLAEDVEQAMVADTGLASRGIRRAPFYVILHGDWPAVLVEGGFLSNPAEARRISTPAFHAQEAAALRQALVRFLAGG